MEIMLLELCKSMRPTDGVSVQLSGQFLNSTGCHPCAQLGTATAGDIVNDSQG